MPDLTVTVKCVQHRVLVTAGSKEGVIEHTGGNVDRYCGSQRFVLRWEETADRDSALAAMTEDNPAPR